MNQSNKNAIQPTAHLFNVDLLIESESNAKAVEQLLHLLNKAGFTDYRIKSGMEFGQIIEKLEAHTTSKDIPVVPSTTPLQTADSDTSFVTNRIKDFIANNALIRISVNKGFGVKLNLPCRIINLDESTQILTVYHVDEKQVYAFSLNEIDDFI